MPTFRKLLVLFLVVYCVIDVAEVSAQRSKPPSKPSLWQTLNGNAPIVIARGGFSGIFPDSSFNAYSLAVMTSLPNVVLWCDVQLTKDAAGLCLPFVTINNSTDIGGVKKNGQKNYMINGVLTSGLFSVDYTLDDFQNVSVTQGIFSRSNRFDGNEFPVLTVDDLVTQVQPPGLWLNIQHDLFYAQHNLSMRSFVLSVSRRVIVNYISSPEVGFLRSITTRFNRSVTKLVFRFLDADAIEPSTNQSYSSLLKNLTFIKTFASGILVPKNYIWPVNDALYLQPHTSVVSDAHRAGLEVFASDFANDGALSYNYSYDPVLEYLNFIEYGDFSVDGVLSDFPITPSSTIDCFSHISKNSSGQATPKVISHNGASGVYPGSTDVAYRQAVDDGVDFIDCSIQMTSDGIPICLSSINLFDCTNVAQSSFINLSMTVPEIQDKPGIFTFSLTWKDIQSSLKPVIANPWKDGYNILRNPASKNAGSFLSLADFLTFAIDKPLAGVVISVENAAYLAAKQGLNVTGAVIDALSNSAYKNQTAQEVIIQSTNKSVLLDFMKQSKYKLMYQVDENIRDADDASLKDIKQFSDIIAITKDSVYPVNVLFVTGATNIVKRLHSFNFTVYVFLFNNEYVSQAWDFFSDPYVEINSFVMAGEIDGVITDFPGTAVMYRRNRCLSMGDKTPNYMKPVEPAGLVGVIRSPDYLPPAEAPNPVLTEKDVAEPPLPPVTKPTQTPNTDGSAAGPTPPSPSGHPRFAAGVLLSSLFVLSACLLLH